MHIRCCTSHIFKLRPHELKVTGDGFKNWTTRRIEVLLPLATSPSAVRLGEGGEPGASSGCLHDNNMSEVKEASRSVFHILMTCFGSTLVENGLIILYSIL